MEMRMTFHDGAVEIESISILEDLWHDYQFFKTRALEFEQPEPSPGARFIGKRYRRAALLMLVFGVEGVLNRWLKHLLPEPEWRSIERRSLQYNIGTSEQKAEDKLLHDQD